MLTHGAIALMEIVELVNNHGKRAKRGRSRDLEHPPG